MVVLFSSAQGQFRHVHPPHINNGYYRTQYTRTHVRLTGGSHRQLNSKQSNKLSTRHEAHQKFERNASGSLSSRLQRQCVHCSYDALRGFEISQAQTGVSSPVLSLWQAEPSSRCAIIFMTHYADLSSWELAQKLKKKLPDLQARGVKVIAVGLGSVENARAFARVLDFPLDILYADSTGAMYRALGFSAGFAPEAAVSPYLKLLPMLMGIGSPGTIQEVLRGYIGDRSAKPVFEGSTPFNVLGGGYQRPFELATLRLSNMVGILPKWSELCPPDESLLTQQGGSLLFQGLEVIYSHRDSGILKYTDLEALLNAVPAVYTLPN